jgi:hypothetical protein
MHLRFLTPFIVTGRQAARIDVIYQANNLQSGPLTAHKRSELQHFSAVFDFSGAQQ